MHLYFLILMFTIYKSEEVVSVVLEVVGRINSNIYDS